jgi:hypothetical protein
MLWVRRKCSPLGTVDSIPSFEVVAARLGNTGVTCRRCTSTSSRPTITQQRSSSATSIADVARPLVSIL